jgi:2-polyprenyl-3-methyl-5-hydroxy-6-metoxy-1,4-benzoquinol methylase
VTWWAELYDDALADVLLERTDAASIERTLGFLRRVLAIAPGDRVFDQCCGIGSLAIPLARAGFDVVGVDQAARYIERAAAAAAAANVTLELAAGDAFEWLPARPCAAGFNWWTSFGYADTDAENLKMLARAADALLPGGRFALDTMNIPQVLRAFAPTVTITRASITLVRDTTLDLGGGVMHKTWRYTLPDGSRTEHTSKLRLYMPRELGDLFRAAGFDDLAFYGDETGEPLAIDSPRCIVVGRKAAR